MDRQKTALNSYTVTSIATANRGKLLIMLYEAAIRHIQESIILMADFKNYAKINEKLKKVNDILEELIASLNKKEGGQLAERLESIYLYVFDLVFKSNANKNIEGLKEASTLLEDLLSAWKVAVEKENDNLDKEMKNSRFSVKS